jgi:hypothetical protein
VRAGARLPVPVPGACKWSETGGVAAFFFFFFGGGREATGEYVGRVGVIEIESMRMREVMVFVLTFFSHGQQHPQPKLGDLSPNHACRRRSDEEETNEEL